MKSQEPFSFKKRMLSFGYALNGLWQFFKTEHNLWIHCVIALLAVVLGFVLRISRMEWIAVIIVIGIVLSAEAFNSCIEKTLDHLTPEKHEKVRYIKDLAAGAVLLTAIAAAIVGLLIFLPKILNCF